MAQPTPTQRVVTPAAPVAPADTVARPHARSRTEPLVARWRWLAYPVVLWAFTRAALLGVAYWGLAFMPTLHVTGGNSPFRQQHPALDAFCRHDCPWFLRIATQGYWDARSTNFFPLFPFLTRAVHEITRLDMRYTMLIVANGAGLLALIVVYRIFLDLADTETAQWGLAALAAFPFSFFQAAAYPESLMMLFGALAIFLALRGHHIWAGVALGVGSLSRHLTLFAGAGLLTAQLRERGRSPRRFLLSPAILGLVIPWLFLGGYCLYQYLRFGDALAWYHARSSPIWARSWWGIDELLRTPATDVEVSVMRSYIPFALISSLGAVALLTQRKWLELAAFGLVLMAVVWSVGVWGLGRYAASCWPAFLPIGALLARRPMLRAPVIALLAIFQGLFFYLFTHQFFIL